jgi:hypothetical protein
MADASVEEPIIGSIEGTYFKGFMKKELPEIEFQAASDFSFPIHPYGMLTTR